MSLYVPSDISILEIESHSEIWILGWKYLIDP